MDRKTTMAAAALAAMTLAAGCSHQHGKKTDGASVAAKGECWGVNACKGQGECGGVGHACAGKNACKGQGWIALTKADCDARKGSYKAQ
jgi:uncharacterized membrane protein